MGASPGDASLIDRNIEAVFNSQTEDSQYFSREEMIRLPMLYERTHEFPWYFCDFIRFSNRRRSSRSIPHLAPTAQPRHLVCASCPPRTASRRVRIRTVSDRRNGRSMEYTSSCNVPGSLPMDLRHCLST